MCEDRVGQIAAQASCPNKYPVSPDVPEISVVTETLCAIPGLVPFTCSELIRDLCAN